MPSQPYGAPKVPMFNPNGIIQAIADKLGANIIQVYVVVAICVVVGVYVVILIWQEYKKKPIKHKAARWGKSLKLSDMLRKR